MFPTLTLTKPDNALHSSFLVFLLLFLSTITLAQENQSASTRANPVDWVNPYIGTAGAGSDYGGTMPLVTTPG